MHCPETPVHQPFNPANSGHERKKNHIQPGDEKRRAAFKEERRKISPEEQQQEITMGETRICIWYLGHGKQNMKGCLIQGNKNARLMGNNYPPSLP
jgi:hypothetical protein